MGEAVTAQPAARLRSSGFAVLRAPLLPFEELEALLGAELEAGADGAGQGLRELVSRPVVAEAIRLASPVLAERVARWLTDPDGGGADAGKVEAALTAYVVRMASRATPFGLFAGCQTGSFGSATSLRVGDLDHGWRHSRPDTEVLAAAAERLAAEPATRSALTFVPNSSAYRLGGRLRLIASRVRDGERSHHLLALDEDEALRSALAAAADGATVGQLAARLAQGAEVGVEEATEYVGELIDAQVLMPTAEPPVTGREPLEQMIDALRTQPATADAAGALEATGELLRRLDEAGLGQPTSAYAAVERQLRALVPELDPARVVQVDLHRDRAGVVLGSDIVVELTAAVALLHRITPAQADPALERFKQAFAERYGRHEVALMEALDEETGIGFEASNHPAADESPLLAGIDLGPAPDPEVSFGAREQVLLELVSRCRERGERELVLAPDDVQALSVPDRLPLPDALGVMATVGASSEEAIAAGEFKVLVHGISGPSGAQLLGRFCHGDPSLEHAVRAHLRAEEALRPEAVFAEVVHLPEGRVGNILARPVLREHELVLLGRSGAPVERQLGVEELTLALRGGRLVLRSTRLDREVLPRLATAHNPAWRSFGVYRFLAALQADGVASWLGWSWGPLDAASSLPRVSCGRLVLAPAQWRLDTGEIKALSDRETEQRLRAWRQLRDTRSIPRQVLIADGDNRLYVDTESSLLTAAAARVLRGRDHAILLEAFPAPDQLCASGRDGRYTHELLVPFHRADPPVQHRSQTAVGMLLRSRRRFPPGSEWLYAKLYCGTATADRVLVEAIAPLVATGRVAGELDQWFFLRYGDPRLAPPASASTASPAGCTRELLPGSRQRSTRACSTTAGCGGCSSTPTSASWSATAATPASSSRALFSADSDAVHGIVGMLTGTPAWTRAGGYACTVPTSCSPTSALPSTSAANGPQPAATATNKSTHTPPSSAKHSAAAGAPNTPTSKPCSTTPARIRSNPAASHCATAQTRSPRTPPRCANTRTRDV